MDTNVDPALAAKLRETVDEFAEKLDVDTPDISFEPVSLLGRPAHAGFRDETLLICPEATKALSFEQLRTCVAYVIAVRFLICRMERRTRIAQWIWSLAWIGVVVLALARSSFALLWAGIIVVGHSAGFLQTRRSRHRVSQTDALVFRLIGDIDPIIRYIETQGHRTDGPPTPASDVAERRIAALKAIELGQFS